MSGICQIVSIKLVKEDEEERFLKAAKELVKKTKESEGNVNSHLLKNMGAEGVSYVIIEHWSDQESCEKDNEAAYVTEFVKEFEDVVTIEMNKFAEA